MEELAKKSHGAEKIAILKMDVDDLGSINAFGLKRRTSNGTSRDLRTPSRLLILADLLNIFFKGFVNELAEKVFPNSTYIIYSGGDDLLLVGAWNDIYEFAKIVANEFHSFTNNPALRISAGYFIGHSKFPFYQGVALANRALDGFAKENIGKDSISFIGEKLNFNTMNWKTLEKADELYSLLIELIEGKVSRALLFKLEQLLEIENLGGDRAISRTRRTYMLHYIINRFKKAYELHSNNLDKVKQIFSELIGYKISFVRPILRFVEFYTRYEKRV